MLVVREVFYKTAVDFCRPIDIRTQNFTHGLAKKMMVMSALMNSSSLTDRTVTMHMGRWPLEQ